MAVNSMVIKCAYSTFNNMDQASPNDNGKVSRGANCPINNFDEPPSKLVDDNELV